MQTVPDRESTAAPVLLPLRLRHETRAQHEALEAALDLAGEGLTRDVYRQRLEQFYGYYRPVEARLLALGGWPERGIDLEARGKVPLLEADLQALGVVELEALPLCATLPDLAGVPQAFGCLYVLEGATLGGQVITRHLRRTLGVEPDSGGRFFHSYGEQVPAMWKAFLAALVAAVATPDAEDLTVRSALETFETFHRWITRGR